MAGAPKSLGRQVVWVLTFVFAFFLVKELMQTWYEHKSPEEIQHTLQVQMERLKVDAAKGKPGEPVAIAMQELATEQNAAKLATQSGDKKAETAADMYIGFLLINTKARPAFCKEQGIEIPAWIEAFENVNAAETARAREIHAKTGFHEDRMYALAADQFKKLVAEDINEIASDSKVSLRDACKVFEDRADEIAINMSYEKSQPTAYKALMTP